MGATFFQGAIPDSHTKIQSDSMNLEFSKILIFFNVYYFFLYKLCILEEDHVSNLFSGGHS